MATEKPIKKIIMDIGTPELAISDEEKYRKLLRENSEETQDYIRKYELYRELNASAEELDYILSMIDTLGVKRKWLSKEYLRAINNK